MSQSGGDKAYFESLDDGSKKFTVQYNPKEFQVSKSLTWEESKTQGLAVNPLQFQKGAPMTASFDLIFDTTGESSATNVRDAWVNGLLALTNSDAKPKAGEEAELGKTRPHALIFTWGAFTMKCVILIHSNPQPWGHPTIDFTDQGRAIPADEREAMAIAAMAIMASPAISTIQPSRMQRSPQTPRLIGRRGRKASSG